jgi:hypothetical protein
VESNYTASPAIRYLSASELTNAFLSTQTNYTFVITNLTDRYCSAQPNNLFNPPFNPLASNTVSVAVYPRPTAAVSGSTSICNGQSASVSAALTGTGPSWYVTWGETWAGGTSNFTVMTYTTNMAALTVSPANSLPNETTNYTFTIVALTDSSPSGCGASSNDLSGGAVVTVNPRPTSVLTSFNATNCNDGTSYTLTNVLTGLGPWTVVWSSNNQPVVQLVTNAVPGPFTNTFTVVPTNAFTDSAFTNVYYVLAISNNATACAGNPPGDITGQVNVTVDPVAAPPTNNGDRTSCYNVAVPLSVSVPPGFTADWYSNATLVASGTNVYVPPVPISLGTNNTGGPNSSLTNTYLVLARYIDPNLTNCYSPGTDVSLISLLCTNTITSITASNNNALISWSGNYVLQSTTNLTPPTVWMNVSTGALGANTWTNSMVPPPTNNFFRLYAPTN